MPKLKEQVAQHIYAPSVGTVAGIHPEDDPASNDGLIEEDDYIYNTKLPSSVRRYKAPPTPAQTRTVMRVTQHEGIPTTKQRASRTTEPKPQVKKKPVQEPQVKQEKQKKQKRIHGLFMWVLACFQCLCCG